jgi:hypothetical protein
MYRASVLLNSRLFPDMFPLVRQVQTVLCHKGVELGKKDYLRPGRS